MFCKSHTKYQFGKSYNLKECGVCRPAHPAGSVESLFVSIWFFLYCQQSDFVSCLATY